MGYMESSGLISITLRAFYRSCLYKVNVGSTGNWAGGHEAGIIERIIVKWLLNRGRHAEKQWLSPAEIEETISDQW